MQAVSLFWSLFFLVLIISCFFWYSGFWEYTQLCLILNDSCLNDPFIHFTFSVAEDDHQWAAWPGQSQGKCLYSSERFAFLFCVVQTRFFVTTSVSTGYQQRTKNSMRHIMRELWRSQLPSLGTANGSEIKQMMLTLSVKQEAFNDYNFCSFCVLLFIRHAEPAFKLGFIIKPFL